MNPNEQRLKDAAAAARPGRHGFEPRERALQPLLRFVQSCHDAIPGLAPRQGYASRRLDAG